MADSRKISEMPAKASLVDADDIAIVDSEVADPLSPLKNKRVSQAVAFATLTKETDFNAHTADDDRHLTAPQNDAVDAADNPSGANEFLTRSGGDALYDAINSAAGVQANLETHKTSADHDGRYYTETEVDSLVAQRVAKAGDTMTGPLTLPGNPTLNLHAATKQYVDSVGVGTFLHADLTDTALDGHPGSVITIAGGGTNNAVTIAADDSLQDAGFVPEVAGAAAAVQTNLDTHTGTDAKTAHPDGINQTDLTNHRSAADQHLISGVTGLQTALDAKLALAGGVMTGLLTLSGAPTLDLHAATKKYVDDNVGGPGTDELVKVSATDTTAKYLLACLFSGDASVNFTLTNAGGNETIDVRAIGVGGGQDNTGENIGTGAGWYSGMNGTILQFKSAVNTTSFQWTSNVDNLQGNVQFGTGAGVAAEGNHLHPGVYDPAGSAAAVQTNLDAHEADLANPHATTAAQVGADPAGSAAAVQTDLDTHKTGIDHDGRYYTEAEVDALVAARVAKAGDTMTGLLTLSGDPTAPLHAVTKQYADGLGGGSTTIVTDTPPDPTAYPDGTLWFRPNTGATYVKYTDQSANQIWLESKRPAAAVGADLRLDGYTTQGRTTDLPTIGNIDVPMDNRDREITLTGTAELRFDPAALPVAPITGKSVVIIDGNGQTLTFETGVYWPGGNIVNPGPAGQKTRYEMSTTPTGLKMIRAEVYQLV